MTFIVARIKGNELKGAIKAVRALLIIEFEDDSKVYVYERTSAAPSNESACTVFMGR
jgi:hypothetical protein